MIRHYLAGFSMMLMGCGSIAEPPDDTVGAPRDGANGEAGAPGSNGSSGTTDPIPTSIVLGPSDFTLATSGAVASFTATADTANSVDGSASERLEAPLNTSQKSCGDVSAEHAIGSSYWGKRLRLRTKVKTANLTIPESAAVAFTATTPAGDWVSTSPLGSGSSTLEGATDWLELALVLDIPAQFTKVRCTARFCGGGQLWLGPVTIEEVPTSVPLTPYFFGKTSS